MINDNGVFIMKTKDGYLFSYLLSASDDIEVELEIKRYNLKRFLKVVGKKSLQEIDVSDILSQETMIYSD